MDQRNERNPTTILWLGVALLLSGLAVGVAPLGNCGNILLTPDCNQKLSGLAIVTWALIIVGAIAIITYFVHSARGASTPPAIRGASAPDIAVQLKHLADLHGQGVLSDPEYQAAKTRILRPDLTSDGGPD